MSLSAFEDRRRTEQLDRPALAALQLQKLNTLLENILPTNRFYAEKLAGTRTPLRTLAELAELPFTLKEELIAASTQPPLAANLTYPPERYNRFHQTSGTHGRPMVVLDTAEDWPWWLECWQYVLDAAQLTASDTVLLAFSFGPFIGFWSAYEAAAARGCLVVPAGGLSTRGRLELLERSHATALFCTPSYALHLIEVAEEAGVPLGKLPVKTLVLAGEPGGSLPGVRARLEQAWPANVIDHAGASELGPWGYGTAAGGGIHVMESEFIAEFISVETGQPADDGELAELVLTNLGRIGCPLIRYRTGDLVRPVHDHPGDNRFVFLDGGVISRTDDMLVIRGVNVYPSALDQILRSFPEIVEYRTCVRRVAAMDQLHVEIEDHLNRPERVAQEIQLRLGLRVEVTPVKIGTLPRFEGKGRRFIDERGL